MNSTHEVLWRQRIPRLRGAALGLSPRWPMASGGVARRGNHRARRGHVGTAEFVERRWPVADARDAWINADHDGRLADRSSSRPGTTAACSDICRRASGGIGLLLHGGTEWSRYWLAGEHGGRGRWASRASAPTVRPSTTERRPSLQRVRWRTNTTDPASMPVTARLRRSAVSTADSSRWTREPTDG